MIPGSLIDFFKRHNMYDFETFRYIEQNLDIIDYEDEDLRMFIGCGLKHNLKDKLLGFRVCIPYPNNHKTMLIAIHELTHAIEAYNHLDKKFKKDAYIEIMPILMEKVYIEESCDSKVQEFGNYLDCLIDNESDISYRCALSVRDELYNNYNNNYKKTSKKAKRLAKRYQRNNS